MEQSDSKYPTLHTQVPLAHTPCPLQPFLHFLLAQSMPSQPALQREGKQREGEGGALVL